MNELTTNNVMALAPSRVESHTFMPGMEVRCAIIDGQPWFMHVDACRALDIRNSWDAIRRVDAGDRARCDIGLRGQAPWLVNETGLRALVDSTRKTRTGEFKRWITHDVLPLLRAAARADALRKRQEEEDAVMAESLKLAHAILAQRARMQATRAVPRAASH